MKIIQSFWAGNPADSEKNFGWLSRKYNFLGWILSAAQLRKFYEDVELITDDYGYDLLIEKLKLPYRKVHVVLEDLNRYNEKLWALAKIKSYSFLDEPFLHMDGDVFIWRAFDQELMSAGLITQNIETTSNYYREMWNGIRPNLRYIPEAMEKFDAGIHNKAFNMGIFGGTDLCFINAYANASFSFVEKNFDVLDQIDLFNFNIFFEQVLFHELALDNGKEVNTFIKDNIGDNEYKGFGSFDEVPHSRTYLHLLGFFKRHVEVCRKLEVYVLKYYPQYYQNLERLLNHTKPLSLAGYEYSISQNEKLERDYEEYLLNDQPNGKTTDNTLLILSRNLYMEGQLNKFTNMKESVEPFIVRPTSNFELSIGREDGQQYLDIKEIDGEELKIPLMDIDEIIFNELDGKCEGKEFEVRALNYLSDDFPDEEKPAFIETLWLRISYFISLNVLVPLVYQKKESYSYKEIGQ